MVSDPVGDTFKISGPGSTPSYLDIATAEVTKQGENFEFSMGLAAPVPSKPALVPRVRQFWWFWALEADPATFPTGFPRAPGQALPPEFAVAVELGWRSVHGLRRRSETHSRLRSAGGAVGGPDQRATRRKPLQRSSSQPGGAWRMCLEGMPRGFACTRPRGAISPRTCVSVPFCRAPQRLRRC
jgi:hypothetical protein